MNPIGLKRGTVELAPYNPDWSIAFETEKQQLLSNLKDIRHIKHIGSTSVPGLAAKPIIDMMAAIDSLADYQQYIGPLQKMGYEYMPERVFSDRVFFPKGPRENRTHHLSLVEVGSEQWENSLVFRDYLRAHPDICREYHLLKEDLAQKYPDNRALYTKSKTLFIEKVLQLARKKR